MNRVILSLVVLLVVGLVVLPIVFYVSKFGIGLWSDHEDWARMGSYFGGVMGPIVTSISIVFLGYQIREQFLEKRESRILAICEECESDIKEYAEKIRNHLLLEENQVALDEVLRRNKATVEGGNPEEGKEIIREFIANNLELSSMWVQIDASMRTLSNLNRRKLKRMNAYLFSKLHVKNLVGLHVLHQELTGGNEPSFFDLVRDSVKA